MALIKFPGFNPIEGLLDLQRELDRFFHRPLGFDLGPSGAGVFPAINVFSNGDGWVIRAEVPGVKPDALSVDIERHTLRISGERTAERPARGGYHRRERRFGKFARSVQLPDDLDPEHATAQCRNGILTVRVPKAAQARPRSIKVQPA